MNSLLHKVSAVWRVLAKEGQLVYMPVPIHALLGAVKCVASEDGCHVEFVPSDMDPGILQGMLVVKKVGERQVATIYYASSMEPAEQRYVIAKEIVHLLDDKGVMTTQLNGLENLLEQLTTPGLPAAASPALGAEEDALAGAIELLFPFEARSVLKASLSARKIDNKTIAKAYVVPEWVVELALSDSYHNWIKAIRAKEGIATVGEDPAP